MLHVVFDATAMVAAGSGNRLASILIDHAHGHDDLVLYAPMCAVVEADRTRPGAAGHIASLPAFVLLDLDLPAALAVARDDTWEPAHTAYAAAPSPERPEGAVVATAQPERWKDHPVRVLDLTP